MNAYRRGLALLIAATLLIPAPALAQATSLADQWLKYRDRFIAADGRVRDTTNKEISHTEGQGSAMLFAQAFDDRATFDRVWRWTQDKLRRPDSALFSWRWDPNDAAHPVSDSNNASDGDILIAWSLSLAASRWHDRDLDLEARRILADIRGKLIDKVKELSPQTPAILLTGKVKIYDQDTRADAFLAKGMYAPAELLERVRLLLVRKRGPKRSQGRTLPPSSQAGAA